MNHNRDLPGLMPGVQWLRHYPKTWLQPDITPGRRLAAQKNSMAIE